MTDHHDIIRVAPGAIAALLLLSRAETGSCAASPGTDPAAPVAAAAPAPAALPLLGNGSFEEVMRVGSPPKPGAKGAWIIKGAPQAPALWTLNPSFPGDLEVVAGAGAADGRRFVRVVARADRAAHLAQNCPGIRPGLLYRVSLRYRGGPVELKVYEYDAGGALKADRAFAEGDPTTARGDAWATLDGVYKLRTGMRRATLVAAVPAGGAADLDDVRAARLESVGGRIDVRAFGASGSEFETNAEAVAGSNVLRVDDPGDFKPGQGVSVSRCNPHLCDLRIWEENGASTNAYGGRSSTPETQVDLRGYDGTSGAWTVYLLDFAGGSPPTFRWSDDMARTWKGTKVPVTGAWQPLSGGVQVKLSPTRDWTRPCLITFSGRDQWVNTITKVTQYALTLADPAPLAAKGCVVRHTDSAPLQAAFDRAAAEGRDLFLPHGRYRLTHGLVLRAADGIRIEGESEERTILDIADGTGPCLTLRGGTSITLRNLRFHGFSGFAERKIMGGMPLPGYRKMWGFYVKHCSAVSIRSPERVLVENCHATGMSAECFYSSSASRSGNAEPASYTRSIVYRGCTVTDCARNAFNNNDMAENTAVLHCRVQDVGGCTWEGASRFVQFTGNYVRNAGTVAMGNIRSRASHLDVLPSGQHLVAHNTFEQETCYGGCAIRSSAGSTPVLVTDNIFVNFNSSAIEASGFGDERNLPAANTIIRGNAIDLTCVRDEARARTGIAVSADDAIVSDNQIYVRGEIDPLAQGVFLHEPARNILVHDNIIRGCGTGLRAEALVGRVAETIDKRTFRSSGRLPWPRRRTHGYRGWEIAWERAGRAEPGPVIEVFDADAGLFRLGADAAPECGAAFHVHSPQGPAWDIHHNAITNCAQLAHLDVFGGSTALFSENILARGEAAGVKIAVAIRGAFRVTDNHFAGFDEPGSIALLLRPDRFGRPGRITLRDNSFERCAAPLRDEDAAH